MSTEENDWLVLRSPDAHGQCEVPRRRVWECGDASPLLRRRLVAVEAPHASKPARTPPLARAVNAPFRTHAFLSSTATSRLRESGDKSPHSKSR